VGTSKPSVVETNVSQSAGSKASLAEVGLVATSHEKGFQKSSRALALSACSSRLFISTVFEVEKKLLQTVYSKLGMNSQKFCFGSGVVFLKSSDRCTTGANRGELSRACDREHAQSRRRCWGRCSWRRALPRLLSRLPPSGAPDTAGVALTFLHMSRPR